MPYTVEKPPDAIKGLPQHLIEIWVAAFNAAFIQYKGDEMKSSATAWTAVKTKYEKVDDKWVAKEAVHPHGEHVCYCPKCNEEITVKENVKCNTQVCPECGTRMRAKDIGERRESMDDKRESLQAALMARYGVAEEASPKPESITVEEVYDTELIYNIDGQSYKLSYEVAEDGYSFGEPEKVVKQITYEPMEALQVVYAEIIQEAGKRNASQDSGRIKKIMELCQELLSSDDMDITKLKKAVKEATSTLTWLKEQAVMQTEDGVKYPSAAYAYVPDVEKSSTWKLRVWEDLDKKVTKAQLGRLAAALSPGGFRGQKVAIPAADLSAVKRKIRTEYRKLEVADEDIPRWVKETETRELVYNYIPLTEAKFDKGRATVVVIRPGFNSDKSRYYPAEMLKRDFGVFEGHKMYADHPTVEEDKERPERSIKDWVATLSEVTCDDNGVVTGVAEVIEPWLMQKLASLRDRGMLNEMGISINAVGSASKATIEGSETMVIEKLVAARSVDFVTEPGAGGIVTFYESDRFDIDLVDLEGIKDRRPDLVKTIEATVRAKIQQEVKRTMELEEKVKELEENISTLTTERDELQGKITEAEKEKAKAEARAIIKEAVDKAELPNAAKEKILERFADAESAKGIEDAIQSEIDYIAKLSEAGKVKDLGASKPEVSNDSLKESWKKLNPEWTDAQIEIAVSGR